MRNVIQYAGKNVWLTVADKLHNQVAQRKVINRAETPEHYLGYVEPKKTPIILIHGYNAPWQKFGIVGDHVSLLGHPVHVIKNLGRNLIDVPSSAKKVRDHVDMADIKNAVIIAHSKGCLIGKYMLINFNKDNRIIGMVALAGPFNGTAVAKLLPFNNVKELDIDSDLVISLIRSKEVNSRIISVYPKHDDTIWAEKGSYLDGALDNIVLNIRGHDNTIFNKESLKVITESVERLSKLFAE
ncbi:hypothetical protein A2872_04000 [Candidatus Gottesmanbacteria bacterium RIFCSPHIGHO2_01_FULL_42_12]|uniref:Alpha/beta hydrolase n=1 Tax=Candidatus Gottesmanbacteria bacterium RIFCSPHIGHO2_01_FULL_42_12 TaxID=1798377 RepID=A0A1F5Z467_9BACT|nr:MAG: hypothetical protein A2872_04000 [Candidatus Gottesmanbacteria bacterium RIFCSPHIGHO2_01_FULL_42_12]